MENPNFGGLGCLIEFVPVDSRVYLLDSEEHVPPHAVGGEVAAAPTVFLGWLVSVDPRLSLFCYLNADLWLVSVSVWPLTLLRCRLLTEFVGMRTVCFNQTTTEENHQADHDHLVVLLPD